MEVIYEDNHIIAVDKTCREIVQGDKTGDKPLSEMLKVWLKEKYCKPGNVFVGVTHRLDRPLWRQHVPALPAWLQREVRGYRREPVLIGTDYQPSFSDCPIRGV